MNLRCVLECFQWSCHRVKLCAACFVRKQPSRRVCGWMFQCVVRFTVQCSRVFEKNWFSKSTLERRTGLRSAGWLMHQVPNTMQLLCVLCCALCVSLEAFSCRAAWAASIARSVFTAVKSAARQPFLWINQLLQTFEASGSSFLDFLMCKPLSHLVQVRHSKLLIWWLEFALFAVKPKQLLCLKAVAVFGSWAGYQLELLSHTEWDYVERPSSSVSGSLLHLETCSWRTEDSQCFLLRFLPFSCIYVAHVWQLVPVVWTHL